MAKEKFFTAIPVPLANKVRREAKFKGITSSELIASIVDSYFEKQELLEVALTTFREASIARLNTNALAKQVYGEEEWAESRKAIEQKVAEDIQRLWG
jgi:hypothetical protein